MAPGELGKGRQVQGAEDSRQLVIVNPIVGSNKKNVLKKFCCVNSMCRSVEKDLEAQITIVTKNLQLQEQMHSEQQRLFDESTLVTKETFLLPERKIPTWVTWVVATARNFF